MGLTLGEIPDITEAKFGSLITTLLIYSRDKDATEKNLTPFSLFNQRQHIISTTLSTYHAMPMQLTNGALLQMLLSSCNIMTCWEVIIDLLSDPTTRENLGLGVAEAPLQVGYGTRVGALLPKVCWVGPVNITVGAACIMWSVSMARFEVDFGVPRMGAPLPLPSIGCPWANWASRLTTPAMDDDANRTLAVRICNFMMDDDQKE